MKITRELGLISLCGSGMLTGEIREAARARPPTSTAPLWCTTGQRFRLAARSLLTLLRLLSCSDRRR